MYSPIMRRFATVLLMATAAWILAACRTASRQAVAPVPESEQVIGEALKELYMAASTAPPQSQEQQKLVLRMAQKASNGKELLLVMRASAGIFPSAGAPAPQSLENQVRYTVAEKLMQFATLDQLIDYARLYPVDAEHARRFVERMLELGAATSDARAWYRIRSVASRLKEPDLEQQALAKAAQLSAR